MMAAATSDKGMCEVTREVHSERRDAPAVEFRLQRGVAPGAVPGAVDEDDGEVRGRARRRLDLLAREPHAVVRADRRRDPVDRHGRREIGRAHV